MSAFTALMWSYLIMFVYAVLVNEACEKVSFGKVVSIYNYPMFTRYMSKISHGKLDRVIPQSFAVFLLLSPLLVIPKSITLIRTSLAIRRRVLMMEKSIKVLILIAEDLRKFIRDEKERMTIDTEVIRLTALAKSLRDTKSEPL